MNELNQRRVGLIEFLKKLATPYHAIHDELHTHFYLIEDKNARIILEYFTLRRKPLAKN